MSDPFPAPSPYRDGLKSSLSPASLTATTFAYADAPRTRRGEKLIYARQDYPGCLVAEARLSALEGGAAAMLFSSGMAAITSFFMALDPGDEVVLPRNIYWPQLVWLHDFAERVGLELIWTEGASVADFARAVTPRTRIVWVEILSNPNLEMIDVAALARMLPDHTALAVNATCLSPALVKPLELGADYVLHSASKILGGHNDVLGGAISCAADTPSWRRIAHIRWLHGNGMSARDATILERSLTTLAPRMEVASRNALEVALALQHHPQIARVRYIGLPDHPDHPKALRNLNGNGFGPLIGLDMRLPAEACRALCNATELWTNATGFGSVISTLEHRATAEYFVSQSQRNYLRLSVGLESPADLVRDLLQAIEIPVLQAAV